MRHANQTLQILLWAFAFVYVVVSSLQITQVDLWWQLSEGAHILRTWTLPTEPVAAFGLPASPYFDEYAGYEIVLTLLYKVLGFFGLWIVFSFIYLTIIFLPVAASKNRYPAFDFSSAAALLLAGILMRERLEQRPELVGTLLLVVLLATLRRARLENVTRSLVAIIFAIFVFWTNTHSTFVLGFFALGLWIAAEFVQKYRGHSTKRLFCNGLVLGGAALCASVLNPYGPRRLLFPMAQALDPGSLALSPEMWPVTNYSTVTGILIVLSVILLLWGWATTRGLPVWLILFSIFSVCLALKSLRFINLLAVSILFVYATRASTIAMRPSVWPAPVRLLHHLALALLCLFLMFGAAFEFAAEYSEIKSEPALGTHTRRFPVGVCSIRVDAKREKVPVLCGHGTGAYLSREGAGQFQPLLDSGLSHFSDDTKRYFFFISHEPEALQLALGQLNLNYAILDRETFDLIPTMQRLHEWHYLTGDGSGLLMERSAGPRELNKAQRMQIETSVAMLQQNNKIADAFSYSTLLERPEASLRILALLEQAELSDSLFNAVSAWIDALPLEVIEDFLVHNNQSRSNPLVVAMLTERLGHEPFAQFIATNPPGIRPWFWQALQVRDCLREGDIPQAHAAFDAIAPPAISSVAYYKLWHQVRSGPTSLPDSGLSAYSKWQSWDDDARQFIRTTSQRLNDRISIVNPPQNP